VLAAVRAESGVTATVLGVLLSLVVLGIIVPARLWLNGFEREPPALLAFVFEWGACAPLGVITLNHIGGSLVGAQAGDWMIDIAVARVVEETLKELASLPILVFCRREIDGIVEGLVYAGLSAADRGAAARALLRGGPAHHLECGRGVCGDGRAVALPGGCKCRCSRSSWRSWSRIAVVRRGSSTCTCTTTSRPATSPSPR